VRVNLAMRRNPFEAEIHARIAAFAAELAELIKHATLRSMDEVLREPPPTPTARSSRKPRLAQYEIQPAVAAGARKHDVSSAGTREPVSLPLYERMAYQRALAECGGDLLAAAKKLRVGKSTIYRRVHALGIGLDGLGASDAYVVTAEPVSLDAYERMAIERALRERDGDRLAAAKLLRIGKSTLYRLAKRHGVR